MAVTIKKGMKKKEMEEIIQKSKTYIKYSNLAELAGKLKTDIDPLEFQKKMRNEWK